MDAKQVIKGLTIVMLAGAALEAAYAETAAAEPATELHAADAGTVPREAKVQPSAPDAAAMPVKAADEAAGPDTDHGAPAPAAGSGDKPYSIQRVLSGAGDLFDRAKNFVTQSGK